MNLLLDTCAFIWLFSDPSQLSPHADTLVRDRNNRVWLSTASVWEIIVKVRRGKLVLKEDIRRIVRDQVQKNAVRILSLRIRHVYRNRTLPLIHHDPFDRILVCQALAEGLTIVTPDHHIRQYPVPTEW